MQNPQNPQNIQKLQTFIAPIIMGHLPTIGKFQFKSKNIPFIIKTIKINS